MVDTTKRDTDVFYPNPIQRIIIIEGMRDNDSFLFEQDLKMQIRFGGL